MVGAVRTSGCFLALGLVVSLGACSSTWVAYDTNLANRGYPTAQVDLASSYLLGQGVDKDPIAAAHWTYRAAKQGLPEAQNNMGVLYARGQGVDQDFVEAARWYRLAADQDYAMAQVNLGLAYDMGLGVPSDTEQAAYWWQKAAAQGDQAAHQNIRHLRETAWSVPGCDNGGIPRAWRCPTPMGEQ